MFDDSSGLTNLDPQFHGPRGAGSPVQPSEGSIEALRSSVVGYQVSLNHLRSAITKYVADLKATHLSPEQVVIAVKHFVRDLPRWAQPTDGVLPADVTVVDKATQWAIEAFYDHENADRENARSTARSSTSAA